MICLELGSITTSTFPVRPSLERRYRSTSPGLLISSQSPISPKLQLAALIALSSHFYSRNDLIPMPSLLLAGSEDQSKANLPLLLVKPCVVKYPDLQGQCLIPLLVFKCTAWCRSTFTEIMQLRLSPSIISFFITYGALNDSHQPFHPTGEGPVRLSESSLPSLHPPSVDKYLACVAAFIRLWAVSCSSCIGINRFLAWTD